MIPFFISIADILLSKRHSYSNFEWSKLHQTAEKSACYLQIGSCGIESSFLHLGIFLLIIGMGTYWSMKKYQLPKDRFKFIATLIIGLPTSNYILGWGAFAIIFIVSVLKFGFV